MSSPKSPDHAFLSQNLESLKKFVNSLNEGFELLELVFENEGNVVDFVFLEVNPAYEKQTGLKAADLIGKRKKEVAPASEQRWYDYAIQAAKTGKTLQYEYYNNKVNGYFDTQFIPISKNQIAVLFKDITERRKAEIALNESEEKYRNLVENSKDAIAVVDFRGNVLFANKAAETLTGYTFGEKIKPNIRTITPKRLWPKSIAMLLKAKMGKAIPYFEYELKRKDGKIISVETGGQAIYKDGKPAAIQIITRDITERKKAEEESKRDSQRINEILESISDDFMVLDQSWNYVYANSQAAKLVGLKPKEIVGRNFWELFPQNKGTYIEQNLCEAMEKKEIRRFELLGQYSHKYKLVTTYPSVEGIALIATDITERKALEKQLQDTERLAVIGQTAGMVGHDIRNPLQAVLSDTYLLKDELSAMPECKTKEGVAESIEDIEKNVGYINKIVQDLQDYSRSIIPEIKETNLSNVFLDIFKIVNVPDSIKLSINVIDAEKINTDPMLLQRAFTNIVTNAIQAMPGGGNLEIKGHIQGDRVFVSISDTGVGIPEEVKPKLFTPMITTKAKGQGFGLAVAKRIIEALKGTITFESEKGKGTKFTISCHLMVVEKIADVSK